MGDYMQYSQEFLVCLSNFGTFIGLKKKEKKRGKKGEVFPALCFRAQNDYQLQE